MAKIQKKSSSPGIPLGSLVKDIITGFTGIAVSRSEFGYGCVHIHIQARGMTRDGDPIPVHSFDDQRVELIEPPTKVWPQPKATSVRLGDAVRDEVTGRIGIAIAKTVGLEGRTFIIIQDQRLTADGEPQPLHSAAAERVVVIDKRELRVSESSVATSGGPMAGRNAMIPSSSARLGIPS